MGERDLRLMNVKLLLKKAAKHLPARFVHSILYGVYHKSWIHWSCPRTYDEKIHWLMTYRLDQHYSKYADKYEMRKYVAGCGYEDLLIPCYGVWDSIEEIDFEALPYPNIMKLTHGSGKDMYFIMHCPEEKCLVAERFSKWIKLDFSVKHMEYHYHYIKPRIICEKLLGDGKEPLTDYKVVCSSGKPIAVLVCQNRDKGRDYYNLDWKHLEYTLKKYQSGKKVERPKGLDVMIEAAAKLSKEFELSRIDFYDMDGQVYIGEITLTPSAGNHSYLSREGQERLGNAIEIDLDKKINVK